MKRGAWGVGALLILGCVTPQTKNQEDNQEIALVPFPYQEDFVPLVEEPFVEEEVPPREEPFEEQDFTPSPGESPLSPEEGSLPPPQEERSPSLGEIPPQERESLSHLKESPPALAEAHPPQEGEEEVLPLAERAPGKKKGPARSPEDDPLLPTKEKEKGTSEEEHKDKGKKKREDPIKEGYFFSLPYDSWRPFPREESKEEGRERPAKSVAPTTTSPVRETPELAKAHVKKTPSSPLEFLQEQERITERPPSRPIPSPGGMDSRASSSEEETRNDRGESDGKDALTPLPPSSFRRQRGPLSPQEEPLVGTPRTPLSFVLEGQGWLYLGEKERKEGVTMTTRRQERDETRFRFLFDQEGEYLLHFSRQGSRGEGEIEAREIPVHIFTHHEAQEAREKESTPLWPEKAFSFEEKVTNALATGNSQVLLDNLDPLLEGQGSPALVRDVARFLAEQGGYGGEVIALADHLLERFPREGGYGEIYFMLAEQFSRDANHRDLKKAKEYYRIVVDRFPLSPYGPRAEKRLEELDRHFFRIY